ncbi:MAG: acetylxylan esterase [Candidatus Poribacteria bacterium]|nr:acetylxylan esterase [Candidatus Poribacteria bacterium]
MAEQHHELAHVFAEASQRVSDARGGTPRTLNTPYTFPGYTKAEWTEKAAALRQQVRVANGLVPMHEPTPLNAEIFGRIERDDYSIEKVYFEPFPGFFTTGNLYRPLGKSGPFPGIVSPHGHWSRGRLESIERGSIPGRCINFAKQGYVIFAYDMIGYNDSGKQIEHNYGGIHEGLWGLNAMGLQLQNSIRSIDFLESLPDVDNERIGCTGASGGGTQTFILTAVDERIKVSAPVNMISATMQGGCICENAPNLRLDASNIEIGALMAPRPLLLVSATGDWTVNTPTVEYPAIRSIYAHFDAEDKVHQVQIDAEHNYNKESREAVYAWFAKWFLEAADTSAFKEVAFEVEPDEALLVFSERDLPPHAMKQDEFLPVWANRSQEALEKVKPTNETELQTFREEMGSALQHALGLNIPKSTDVTLVEPEGAFPTTYDTNVGHSLQAHIQMSARHLIIGRKGMGDAIPALLFSREPQVEHDPVTLIVHPEGKANLINSETGEPSSLITDLLSADQKVLVIDVFGTGEHSDYERSETTNYFTTYNRTTAALRVQDIVTALHCFINRSDVSGVNLIGIGEAGLWSLLATAFTEVKNVVVDAAAYALNSDAAFLETLPIPSIRRAGDLRTAGALVAPRPLAIHNTGDVFDTGWITEVYGDIGAGQAVLVEKDKMSDEEIVAQIIG